MFGHHNEPSKRAKRKEIEMTKKRRMEVERMERLTRKIDDLYSSLIDPDLEGFAALDVAHRLDRFAPLGKLLRMKVQLQDRFAALWKEYERMEIGVDQSDAKVEAA
jgi:hypothetical protein